MNREEIQAELLFLGTRGEETNSIVWSSCSLRKQSYNKQPRHMQARELKQTQEENRDEFAERCWTFSKHLGFFSHCLNDIGLVIQ